MKEKLVSFHIDMDSPAKLIEYWVGLKDGFDSSNLDHFYEVSMERALSLFKKLKIPVTFFCVGEELKNSSSAKKLIKNAYTDGHEIANHTFTHPYGLINLNKEKLVNEVTECSKIIEEVTGQKPVGFRSPGYDMSNLIMNTLDELSFKYDSSAFWSVLIPLMKGYHKLFRKKDIYTCFGGSSSSIPRNPYYPSRNNWKQPQGNSKILEVPLPRTRFFALPFYSNFHIYSGKFFTRIAFSLMREKYFVYLFHLAEFVDYDDGMPKELNAHPTLKLKSSYKISFIENVIKMIKEKYNAIRTDEFVEKFN